MRVVSGAGKAVMMVFWAIAGLNLATPFAHPFASLISLAAVAVLVVHVLELLMFRRRLGALPRPRLARLQVLLFGVFHLLTVPAVGAGAVAQDVEVQHA